MTEIKSAFFGIDNLKRKLLPFLLVTTINSAIVSIYLGTVLTAYIPAIAILTVVLFAAYDFIKTHKWIAHSGGIVDPVFVASVVAVAVHPVVVFRYIGIKDLYLHILRHVGIYGIEQLALHILIVICVARA